MTDLDKMARELLAASVRRGSDTQATYVEYGKAVVVEACDAEHAIRAALLTAPLGYVLVPVELAGRLQASIGAFVSDEGWGAADMGTADDLSALLAAPNRA